MRDRLPERLAVIEYCDTPYAAATRAHALLMLTDWPEYWELASSRLKSLMEVPVVIDGRNMFDPALIRNAGCEYVSMGR